jgi:hypothetical protein
MCPAVSLVSIARLTFLVCLVAVGVSQETGISGSDDNELDDFACSPGSLAKAVPALVDAETGLFTIPDTRSDLAGFFRVQQAITKAIDTALTRSQLSLTPREAAALEHPAILFGPRWRAAESGVSMTHDGKNVTLSPAYGHLSFIHGIVPVEGSAGQYYKVGNASLVSAQPTTLPCVNTILLAEATSAGSWPAQSYLLGKPGEDGWLVVNRCVNLAALNSVNTLSPSAALYLAIEWADVEEFAHMRTNDTSTMHNEGVVGVHSNGRNDGGVLRVGLCGAVLLATMVWT